MKALKTAGQTLIFSHTCGITPVSGSCLTSCYFPAFPPPAPTPGLNLAAPPLKMGAQCSLLRRLLLRTRWRPSSSLPLPGHTQPL